MKFISNLRSRLRRLFKNKYIIKDEILKCVLVFPKDNYKIAEQIDREAALIKYLVEELRNDGLVDLTLITTKLSGSTNDYIVKINNKGIYFLNFDGGHKKIMRQKILSKSWTIAKIIAAIANALAIILLTYYSLVPNKT